MRRTVLSLLALVVLAAPATAAASAGSDAIIGECANEQLSREYTQQEYQDALDQLPADLREYTDCYDVIQSAKRATASGTGGTGDASGAGGAAGAGAGTGTGTGTGAGGTGGTAGTTGGGAIAADPLASASPADQAAAQTAQSQGDDALEVGGATITPGDPGTLVSSLDDLPAPILLLLVLFVVGGLAGLGYFLKRRVLGHHP